MNRINRYFCIASLISIIWFPSSSFPWNDETHIAIAKAAGYRKWFNATAADIVKIKLGKREDDNHYVNNVRGTTITPKMVLDQVKRYNQEDKHGHLYGAIVASFRNYMSDVKRGKFGEYRMAFCAHYVGDLSMPLHNIPYSPYNKEHHKTMDGIINDEVMDHLDKIKLYPIAIHSEKELVDEIVRIANLSATLGFRLEDEKRMITREEAYVQISHSASLFRAILDYGYQFVRDIKTD